MPTFNFNLESCEPPDPIKDTEGMKPIGSWKGDSGQVYHTIDSHGGQLFHHYSVEVEIDTLGPIKREYIAQEMILDVDPEAENVLPDCVVVPFGSTIQFLEEGHPELDELRAQMNGEPDHLEGSE